MSQKFILEISDHIDTTKSFCIRRGLIIQLPNDMLPMFPDTTYNGTSLKKLTHEEFLFSFEEQMIIANALKYYYFLTDENERKLTTHLQNYFNQINPLTKTEPLYETQNLQS